MTGKWQVQSAKLQASRSRFKINREAEVQFIDVPVFHPMKIAQIRVICDNGSPVAHTLGPV
jgi:hypothetical protein